MDPSRILVWNVRGLNSSARQDAVRTILQASKSDIVCLQETKMPVIPQRVVLSMLGSDFSSYLELPAEGSSGGILVAWRQSLGAIGERRIDNHSASVQFCTEEGQAWWLTCVYGPQGNERKVQFLQELHEIRSICHRPWMIAGDFNLIYKAEDNNNGNYNTAMMG
jgi:exonuclease III